MYDKAWRDLRNIQHCPIVKRGCGASDHRFDRGLYSVNGCLIAFAGISAAITIGTLVVKGTEGLADM